jgi:hypothetical protein
VKALLLTYAAAGAIALTLAAPGTAEATQVHVAVNLGIPVVTQHRVGYRPWVHYRPHRGHHLGHRHGRHYAHDHGRNHRPIHHGRVYGGAPAIKRIDVNPRLQRR